MKNITAADTSLCRIAPIMECAEMKIVFLSNFYNYHQEALSLSFCALVDEYVFVETTPMAEDRRKMGWNQENMPSFVIPYETFLRDRDRVAQIILGADVVIIGSAPMSLLRERLKQRKLTFKYSERIFKAPRQYATLPIRAFKYLMDGYRRMYLLSASAYAYGDYRKTLCFKNRAYKWGYFPRVKVYDDMAEIMECKYPDTSILWVARLIECKYPEVPIRVAKRLKADGYRFELNMIGVGKMMADMEALIARYELQDCVHLLGAMRPEEVRAYMEKARLYLFTSDRNEGWGAVLNESMNSGCAVVASSAIGSVPFMIRDGENGYIYPDGDEDALYERVKYLLDNPDKCREVGQAAYETMTDTWNAETAAERFVALCRNLMDGKDGNLYESGPCSRDR